jgi:uncharacterized membrane protein
LKPLIVLLGAFIIALLIARFTTGSWQLLFSGNLAMCLMLFLTAAGHFMFTRGMTLMLPSFLPFRTTLVYITGILEILLGIALLVPALRITAAYILIAFFVLLLPCNIYAAAQHLNMEKATYDGPGLSYLWFRVPLQLLFTGWVYYFSIYLTSN